MAYQDDFNMLKFGCILQSELNDNQPHYINSMKFPVSLATIV